MNATTILDRSMADREIARLVGLLAGRARAARLTQADAHPAPGRDRTRWVEARSLLAAIRQGRHRAEAGERGEILALLERLYEIWPGASTATYLDLHDLELEAAMKALRTAGAAKRPEPEIRTLESVRGAA